MLEVDDLPDLESDDRPPEKPAPRAFPVGLEEAAESMGAFEVVADEDEAKPAKKKKKKRKADADDDAESALDREMRRAVDMEIEKVDEVYGAADEESESPKGSAENRKKRNRQLAIGGAVVAVLALGGYFAFSGDSKPKRDPVPPPRDPVPVAKQEEETPPEPKKVIPKVEPKVVAKAEPGIAPPPRVVLRDPLPFAASRLLAERSEGQAAFDAKFSGAVLQIYGTCGSGAGDVLRLADREGDTGIACTLREGTVSPPLQPGQALTILGVYEGDLRMSNCEVVRVTAPADEEFKDKDIEISGIVLQAAKIGGETNERFPTLVLEPPLTDTLISIRCLFRTTEQENLAKLRPGQPVTVRGRCEGRTFRVVRLHDCSIVPPEEAVLVGAVRAKAERFFAAYEADLLPAPRPDPAGPYIAATAERLAVAFASDVHAANKTYRYKNVEVTGKVLSRGGNTVVLETGTSHQYQVAVVLMPARAALLRDETVMTLRGTCVGVRGGFVRLENGDRYDVDAANPAVRTVAEYFPLQSREFAFDALTVEKAKDNPVTQYQIKFVAPDTIRATVARVGVFPGTSLFAEPLQQPKWLRDFTKLDPKSKLPLPQPRVTHYRVKDGTIELRDIPAPPAQPSAWWDPVFKIGFKSGESWSSDMPDGQTVTYTVVGFSKDQRGRQCVELSRVVKSAKETTTWEGSRITYAVGVGEVRRVVSRHASDGRSITVLEMRLADPTPEAKQPEKK